MIQTVTTHHCTRCNSTNIVKNGTDYKGAQKFHCLDCDAYGTLEPQSRSYSDFVKEFVLRVYRERASMRGVERIFGIACQTLARWILGVVIPRIEILVKFICWKVACSLGCSLVGCVV